MIRKTAEIKLIGALVMAAVLTISCTPKSTVVHIKNASALDLTSIVLSGSRFRIAVPDIPAGGSADVFVYGHGESGLAVSFVAQGRTVSAPEQGYFEAGGYYVGNVVIKEDLTVAVDFR